MKVAVRVRPSLDNKDLPCLQVTPSSNAILFDEGGRRQKFRRYVYDHVFDEDSSQEMVYKTLAAPLVRDVLLHGITGSIFAYGSTGSGMDVDF